ncbi:MAG: hypothetical protein H6591_00530 [Flavobacteriales bacterium]|nr:hypothetical protein [Flavobacteriales bacterium]
MKHPLSLVAFAMAATLSAQVPEPLVLEVSGRISDGDKKLPGCEVVVYDGNDIVGTQLTDKGGRFSLGLGMGKEFAIVFQKEGFLPKRVLVDTRAKIPAEIMELAPLDMEMSMLPASKYDGANTDMLDFPFALVKWSRQQGAFVQDQQYTADMMRTNGAALLQAGRSVKD